MPMKFVQCDGIYASKCAVTNLCGVALKTERTHGMKLHFSQNDRQKLDQFLQIREENNRILELYSIYLNRHPRFLTADMVESFAADCQLSNEEAFRSLFSAAIGLDSSDSPQDRRLERLYLQSGVHELDPSVFRENLYYKTVRFPHTQIGKWKFTTESYHPYEPFVCGHPVLRSDFREIPQIGFFNEEYRFPAVLENGVEWMTVTPNEIETMREPISQAHGRVITFGLGLGYFAFCVSEKPDVSDVTVIERDESLIKLFREHLLEQFPHKEKLRIIRADAFDYAQKEMRAETYDFSFVDLWHDPSDGLELYLRMKRLEGLHTATEFSYWIEPTLLSYLRDMLLNSILDEDAHNGKILTDFSQLTDLLTSDFLRKLAPDIRKQ